MAQTIGKMDNLRDDCMLGVLFTLDLLFKIKSYFPYLLFL